MIIAHDSIIRFYSYFELIHTMFNNISKTEQLHATSKISSMADENSLETSLDTRSDLLPDFLQAIVWELLNLHYSASGASFFKRETHIRHVAIYLLNIGFGISMRRLAKMFNLNRSTIAYACQTVEDRRDDQRYDRFLIVAERIAVLVALNQRTDLT